MEKKPGNPRWIVDEHEIVSLTGIIKSILFLRLCVRNT